MALQITRWSPDTCGCVIEYQWDDTQSEDTRTHTAANTLSKCPAHNSINNIDTHFNILMDENPRKNKLLERLRATYTELTTTDPQGNIVLKDNIVTWSYDANRVLQISVPTLTTAKKNAAQTWADNNLGVGKVKVT